MLNKLLKYEIKATARIFLPLYAVLLAYSLVHALISLLSPDEWSVPKGVSMAIFAMMLVAIFVMTLVVIIQRFYKSLLSDEGYLMFTLPTTTWKHITSKLLVAIMWTAASSIAAFVSICIIAYNLIFTGNFLEQLNGGISEFFSYFGASSILVIVEFLLAVIVGLVSNVLIIYASIALGHLFSKHRVLASLGSFIALNAASQILLSIVSIAASVPFIKEYASQNFNFNAGAFHLVMWYAIITAGLLSVGYYALTNYILNRHLNLE